MAQRPIIETRSGKGINLLDPDPDSLTIEDIAHGASNQCRFGGHVKQFYSVAEHSLLCAHLARDLDIEKQRSIFLHDAHEAYLGDIPTPIKRMLSGFTEIVDLFDQALVKRFDLEAGFDFSELKAIDHLALSIEAKDLMPYNKANWYDGGLIEDTPEITFFDVLSGEEYYFGQLYQPEVACDLFLKKAKDLGIN
jgi:hypothetical protein